MYSVGDILINKNPELNEVPRRIKEVVNPPQEEVDVFGYLNGYKTYKWEYADLPPSIDNEFYSGDSCDPHLDIDWELEVEEEQ